MSSKLSSALCTCHSSGAAQAGEDFPVGAYFQQINRELQKAK